MGRPKSINRDNSRRFYASDAEYPEHMRRTSHKAKDIRYKEKHSEFKKPWGPSEDFTEMEYWLDPLPGFDPWIFDDPVTIIDIPDPRLEGGGGLAVLYCQLSGCYVDGQITCIPLNCSYPITGVDFSGSAPAGFSLAIVGNSLCITAPADAKPAIEVDISMRGKTPDGRVVSGSHESIMITNCNVTSDCVDPTALGWDDSISPETIGQSASATIAVTGGVGPFFWSLTGSGASLGSAMTSGRNNTVITDGAACGPIFITVSDACGQSVIGQIRITVGLFKSCPEPDTSAHGNFISGCQERVSWYDGNFQFSAWCIRCCNETDSHKCGWGQCTGQGLAQTDICADDFGSISCEWGMCWEGSSGYSPGDVKYWDCV